MTTAKTIQPEFPEKLSFLFKRLRYKIARGGRGSAKSWSFARALLIIGVERKIRILCAREVQLSIKQSVHKLLKDQIELMELSEYYEVLESGIGCINGTEINFTGLSTLTVDTIKSFEGVDICWIEEGQVISKRSWDILIPTIRKEESEIWITYNPDLETDETHQRFTIHQPKHCINAEMNWRDNPWFSGVLEEERLHCKENSPDDYDNIWEGKCRSAVDGAIYFKQIQEAETQGRVCNVPYDPMLKVHVVVDLGFNDAMSIGMIQKHVSGLRLIDYIEENQKTLDEYSTLLKERDYNWGKVYLPFSDGFSKDVKTGKGCDDIFKALGWDVVNKTEIASAAVEDGIKQTRMLFRQMYFDKDKCAGLIEALRRYRRHINRKTNAAGSPVHDDFSHGADMLRYVAINIDHMTNEDVDRKEILKKLSITKSRLYAGDNSGGWMG